MTMMREAKVIEQDKSNVKVSDMSEISLQSWALNREMFETCVLQRHK